MFFLVSFFIRLIYLFIFLIDFFIVRINFFIFRIKSSGVRTGHVIGSGAGPFHMSGSDPRTGHVMIPKYCQKLFQNELKIVKIKAWAPKVTAARFQADRSQLLGAQSTHFIEL